VAPPPISRRADDASDAARYRFDFVAMTAVSYFIGVAWLLAVAGALGAAAVRWRTRLCPGWGWIPARIVEVILVSAAAVVIAEVLGAVGLFSRVAVLLVALVVGAAGLALAPRPRAPQAIGTERAPTWEIVFSVAVGAAVLTQWTARVLTALPAGITDVDSQSYHLPHAARWLQEGWLTRLHFIAADEATAYHPSNGEVFHGYGMLAWHRDPLSLVLNLGWLVLVLAAAWCIGRRLGSGAVAVAAVAALFASPLIASTQAASGMTDTVGVFFLLAACYLLLVSTEQRGALVLAGLAGGLALGSKLTFVVPFVGLTVVVVVLARRLGRPYFGAACAWLVPAFLTGSFWYLRNVARVGTPIPTLRIGVDGASLPKPPIALEKYAYTVAHYAFDGRVWTDWFVPGLHRSFGPVWPLLGALTIAAIAVALVRGPAVVRGLALVALGSGVAYVFTQTTAFGPAGRPVLFAANLRYLLPALALGMALLPVVAPNPRVVPVLAAAMAGVLVVTGLAPQAWPADQRGLAVLLGAVACAIALTIVVAPGRGRRVGVAASIGVVVAVVVAGLPIIRGYLHDRYTVAVTGQEAVGAWARGIHNASIGIAGFFIQYPLYGQDLSNRVQYIGHFGSDHSFTDVRTCGQWRKAVNGAGYRFVVISPSFVTDPEPAALQWTRGAPGATEVFAKDRAYVFRIDGRLDPGTCGS
jgi:hypothetical protein